MQQCKELGQSNAHTFTDAVKAQQLQAAVESLSELRTIQAVAQQTGHSNAGSKPMKFSECKALLLSAAAAYDKCQLSKWCPLLRSASAHDALLLAGRANNQEAYSVGAKHVATIYANVAMSKEAMAPSEWLRQLLSEGRRRWRPTSEKGRKAILDQGSSTMSLLAQSSKDGCSHGSFMQERDKARAAKAHDQGSASAEAVGQHTADSSDGPMTTLRA